MPKTIASKSMANVASTILRERAKRSPSATAPRPGRAAPGCGGIGAISRTAAIEAVNVTTSKEKAQATPASWTRMPPKIGPATATVWKLSQLTAMAAWSRSLGTSRGMADERVGWSTAPIPAATNATT